MLTAAQSLVRPIFRIRAGVCLAIAAYLLGVGWYASTKTVLLDWDGPERGLFGAMIADSLRHLGWSPMAWSSQVMDVVRVFHLRFQVGLESVLVWTPLQAMTVAVVSLLGGTTDWAWASVNLAWLVVLAIFVYRLVMLVSADETIAWWTVALVALHPLVVDTAISMARGIGEAACVTAVVYFLTRAQRQHAWRDVWLAWCWWMIGVLYRESMVIMAPWLIGWTIALWWTARRQPSRMSPLRPSRGLMAATAMLAGCVLMYGAAQAWLTTRGVGTLLTKLHAHQTVDVAGGSQRAPRAFITLPDYLRVMYGPFDHLRYAPEARAALEVDPHPMAQKTLAVLHRFGLSPLQKSVFVVSCVFAQWWLLPLVGLGAWVVWRRRRSTLIWGWLAVSAWYAAFLSWYGAIPDYTIPLLPAAAWLAACGLSEASGRLGSMAQRWGVRCAAGLACVASLVGYAILLPRQFYPSNSAVASAILADAPSQGAFTVAVDTWRRPSLALAFWNADQQQRSIVRPFDHTLTPEQFQALMQPKGLVVESRFLGRVQVPPTRYLVMPHLEGDAVAWLRQRYQVPVPFVVWKSMGTLDILKRTS